jgi:hypothetical protein
MWVSIWDSVLGKDVEARSGTRPLLLKIKSWRLTREMHGGQDELTSKTRLIEM